jgi:hypothetical protein
MFIEKNNITFKKNARLDMLFILGLDTLLLSFYD